MCMLNSFATHFLREKNWQPSRSSNLINFCFSEWHSVLVFFLAHFSVLQMFSCLILHYGSVLLFLLHLIPCSYLCHISKWGIWLLLQLTMPLHHTKIGRDHSSFWIMRDSSRYFANVNHFHFAYLSPLILCLDWSYRCFQYLLSWPYPVD